MRRLLLLLSLTLATVVVLAPSSAASSTELRPMKGTCQTTFTIGFDPVAGVPLAHILGTCQFTHLGLTRWDAQQWLYPDGTLVNDGTYTAANGDKLYAHAVGFGPLAGPTVNFTFDEWYTGGTGRFADVVTPPLNGPPSTSGSGSANLLTSTGEFVSSGAIGY